MTGRLRAVAVVLLGLACLAPSIVAVVRAGLGLDGRGNSMLTVDQPAEAPEEEGGQ